MQIDKLPIQPKIEDNSTVTVTEMGNIVGVRFVEKANRKQTIQRLNKDEYIVLSDASGEIFQVNHNETRQDDKNSLRKTFRRIRELINTNCQNTENIRWITLTYEENMQDPKRLYSDFHSFHKRFIRKWGKAEYIVVMEPQARGAWHAHLIYIWDKKAPFIPNELLNEVWGHGFVNIQRVKDCDNLGAYLSAYLGNVPLEEGIKENLLTDIKNIEIVEKEIDGETKRFIKGGRLKWYPAGMNIYRCSRGIKQPEIKKTKYSDIKDELTGYCKTYESAFKLTDEDNNFNSIIITEEYNKVRKK